MPKEKRITLHDQTLLKTMVWRLTGITKRIKDLDTKDKLERAGALIIQALITASFKPNQPDFFD